jgi:hypothetical protein
MRGLFLPHGKRRTASSYCTSIGPVFRASDKPRGQRLSVSLPLLETNFRLACLSSWTLESDRCVKNGWCFVQYALYSYITCYIGRCQLRLYTKLNRTMESTYYRVQVNFALEQAMKVQRESRSMWLSPFFNFGGRWGWVVKPTLRSLCPRERDSVPII